MMDDLPLDHHVFAKEGEIKKKKIQLEFYFVLYVVLSPNENAPYLTINSFYSHVKC